MQGQQRWLWTVVPVRTAKWKYLIVHIQAGLYVYLYMTWVHFSQMYIGGHAGVFYILVENKSLSHSTMFFVCLGYTTDLQTLTSTEIETVLFLKSVFVSMSLWNAQRYLYFVALTSGSLHLYQQIHWWTSIILFSLGSETEKISAFWINIWQFTDGRRK